MYPERFTFDSSPSAEVLTKRDGDRDVVHVSGEADLTTVEPLLDCITLSVSEGSREIVIDLADATFVDCAFVRAMLDARHGLVERPDSLVVWNPSRFVRRVIGLCDATELIAPDLALCEPSH